MPAIEGDGMRFEPVEEGAVVIDGMPQKVVVGLLHRPDQPSIWWWDMAEEPAAEQVI